MNNETYKDFKDINGNEYSFPDYESFASWWFSVPYRRMVVSLSSATFRKLERAATQSREARKKFT